MFKWLKEISLNGFPFPTSVDGAKPASARLLFSHLSFYVAIFCVAADKPQAWTAIAFFSICTMLYMFKEIDKLKFNAQERSLEIEDEHESK